MADNGQDSQDERHEEQVGEEGQHGGPGAGRGGSDEAADNPGTHADAQHERSAVKDPQDWKTGDEPATAAQKSYISTMAVEAHEEVPFELTKAEASEKIEELQKKTGRTGDNLAPQ